MERILQFQSVGGASGDMILAALASLGVDLREVQDTVAGLAPEGVVLRVEEVSSHGLHGIRVTVEADDPPAPGHHHSPHRHLADIRELIEGASLSASVRATSLRVFERIAEAEAEVHATTVESIHFHEVGALDSIADIIGGCLALETLGVDRVVVNPLPLGCGTVDCAHGTYPTPAPATSLLLRGFPVTPTDEPFELVTPTGAALLTTWASDTPAPAGSRILAMGHGFGHRTLNQRPNLLRATLYEADAEVGGESGESEDCLVLECQVDDTQPELLGALMDQLLGAGVLDAYYTPVQMKKQRPGTLVTVLAAPAQRAPLVDLLFRETTTFGVREYTTRRTVLDRRIQTVETVFGPVRIKIGSRQDEDITLAPELEDCRTLAAERGVPVRAVYEAAVAAAHQLGAG